MSITTKQMVPKLPGWLSTGGEPPVTIIEIPVPTTAVAPTTSSEASTPTTVSTQPPATTLTTPPADIGDTASPGLGDSAWPVWIGLGVILLAFVVGLWLRRRATHAQAVPVAELAEVSVSGAPLAISRRGFEAIEYRAGGVLGGSSVRAHSLSTHASLEDAIEVARVARLRFQPDSANSDAWWVVWNLGSQRAAWIAEWGTPGESVIDLRSGRREPYLAGDNHRR